MKLMFLYFPCIGDKLNYMKISGKFGKKLAGYLLPGKTLL